MVACPVHTLIATTTFLRPAFIGTSLIRKKKGENSEASILTKY
jgi:hypothetical protein